MPKHDVSNINRNSWLGLEKTYILNKINTHLHGWYKQITHTPACIVLLGHMVSVTSSDVRKLKMLLILVFSKKQTLFNLNMR